MAEILSCIFSNIFSVIVFLIVCNQLKNLSREVAFYEVQPEEALESTIQLDFCYLINLKNDKPPVDKKLKPNQNAKFTCDFNTRPISSYGKVLKNKTAKYIIEQFKKCKLQNLINLKNLTRIKKISPNVTYKLNADHICVNYQFEIETSVKKTELKIIPVKNNQTFLILASFVRTFQNDGEYRSIKRYIFRRTCRLLDDQLNYLCTETDQNFVLAFHYSRIESLKSPFTTDCVDRGKQIQNDCYESCVKAKIKYISLSYNEKDNFTLNIDKMKIIKPIIERCTETCDQMDCKSGSIALDKITRKDQGNSSILLKIYEIDQKYKASPYYSKIKITWQLIGYFALIFRINFGQLSKLKNFYNYIELKNRRRIKKSKSPLSILIIALICFALAFGLEKFAFDSDEKNYLVSRKIESLKERKLSVSICFDFCDIIKDDSIDKTNCNQEMLMNMKLAKLNRLLWNETDFKMNVRMRNSVQIVYLREMKVHIFYRRFKKCFLIFYRGQNHHPHISLQRKSEIYFDIQTTHFSYYLEDGFHYPKIDSKSVNLSYLVYFTLTDLNGINCTDYSKQVENSLCLSKDDCQQECILVNYVKIENNLPILVNLKIDHFLKYSTLKFSNNSKLHQQVLEQCKSLINKNDCKSSRLKFRSNFNKPECKQPNSNLSINLTPDVYLETYLIEENKLIVLNRIISMMLVLSGFSVLSLIKRLLSKFFSLRLAFVNYEYLKRFCYFIMLLMFLVHFELTLTQLINSEMDNFSFKFYSKFVNLPKIRLCYEIDLDLRANNYTLSMLNNLTLKYDDVFEKVVILNKEHTFKETKKNLSHYISTFYLDNMKCFSLNAKIMKHIDSNYFTLDKSVEIYLKLEQVNKRQFFLHINDHGVFLFDWYKPFFSGHYFIYFSTHEFSYQDDYWHLKNLHLLIKYWLGIEEQKNTQKRYSNYLKSEFNRQQNATTTSVPLYPADEDLIVNNYRFQNFMQFRSLEGKKNDYDFTYNTKRSYFDYDYCNDMSSDLKNRSIISFIPNFTHKKTSTNNKIKLIEFFLHLFVLFAFWFKLSILHLAKSIQKAFPIMKFFVICILYFIVIILIFFLELFLKCIEFLNFRQV